MESVHRIALDLFDNIYPTDPIKADFRKWKDVEMGLQVTRDIGLKEVRPL